MPKKNKVSNVLGVTLEFTNSHTCTPEVHFVAYKIVLLVDLSIPSADICPHVVFKADSVEKICTVFIFH